MIFFRRIFNRLRDLFRKKPVYVTRRFWDANSGCEVVMLVPQGKFYPGMRIDDILDDMSRGVKFNKSYKELLDIIALSLPKENP